VAKVPLNSGGDELVKFVSTERKKYPRSVLFGRENYRSASVRRSIEYTEGTTENRGESYLRSVGGKCKRRLDQLMLMADRELKGPGNDLETRDSHQFIGHRVSGGAV
jgi:hypothetical protein